MKSLIRTCVSMILFMAGVAQAQEGDSWNGLKVVTRYAQPIRVENRTIDDGSKLRIYTVEKNDEGILTIASGQIKGWIWASDVVPYNKAIAFYTDEIAFVPNNSAAYHWRGMIWREKGDVDKANADRIMALYVHGIVLLRVNDYAKALADFDGSVALDPKFVLGYNERAWLQATCPDAHFRNGKGAVESATTACELTAWKHPGYLDTLAAAHAEAGSFEQAIAWQLKAIDAARDNPERGDFEARLALYKANKPYRQQ